MKSLFVLLAFALTLRGHDDVNKLDGCGCGGRVPYVPPSGLLTIGPIPDFDYRHHDDDDCGCEPACATTFASITILDVSVTTETTMIPMVCTAMAISTTVQTVSGCPHTSVLVIPTTTTTSILTVTTSTSVSTSTSSSLTLTTSTTVSTIYTYTKPCHTHCENCPRSRSRSVRSVVGQVYVSSDDDEDDNWRFK